MTKEEYEINYCKESGITREYYNKYFVTLECNCSDTVCVGWACVGNDNLSIDVHNTLYA